MGLCSSSEVDPIDAMVAAEMAAARERDLHYIRVLLLGTGGSGKSTIFRQMIKLHGAGFSQEELNGYRTVVRSNTLQSIWTLLKESKRLVEEGYEKCQVTCEKQSKLLMGLVDSDIGEVMATKSIGKSIKKLWKEDSGIKATYKLRDKFELLESAEYFLDKAKYIFKDDYDVVEDDVLRMRVMTTGMKEEEFDMGSKRMILIDVGGQRSERRKWIKWFNGVSSVLFIAAISEYDQVLFEDASVNRLDEALEVWNTITTLDIFEDTSFILFMNKVDLLESKIKRVPFKDHIKDFDGDGKDIEQVKQYMLNRFDKAAPEGFELFSHFTTATDTELIKNVFENIKSILLSEAASAFGLS